MNTDASASPVPVDFYWRPGCPFCSMLERKLVKAGITLNKLNIWDNEKNASFVRSVADGNETVPTVAVAGQFLVNPRAKDVIALADPVTDSDPARRSSGFLGRLIGD